jgi:hypothetical protein
LLVEPDAKRFDKRLRPRLPICAALFGGAAGYFGLDSVQLADAVQGLAGDRRVAGLRDIVEATTEVMGWTTPAPGIEVP